MCLAIPGQIVEIFSEGSDHRKTALIDVVGVRRKVDLGLLQDDMPEPGEWVLIHVGFAMSKIDENEAHETMKALYTMGDIFSDELKMLQESQIE